MTIPKTELFSTSNKSLSTAELIFSTSIPKITQIYTNPSMLPPTIKTYGTYKPFTNVNLRPEVISDQQPNPINPGKGITERTSVKSQVPSNEQVNVQAPSIKVYKLSHSIQK